MKRALAISLAILAAAVALPGSAMAAVSFSFTEAAHEASILAPGTIDRGDEYVGYSVKLKNSGSETTAGSTKVALALPSGMQFAGGKGSGWTCAVATQSCSSSAAIAAGAEFPQLKIETWVFPQAPDSPVVTFTASGGGAGGETSVQDSFSFGAATPFGLTSLAAGACTEPTVKEDVRSCPEAEAKGAVPSKQAGEHPFAATSSFAFALRVSPANKPVVVESLRDLFIDLPAGFLGNPQAINSICTVTQVRETTGANAVCPETAAVGGIGAELSATSLPESSPLYRIVPEEGYVAAFAFRPVELSLLTVVIRVKVRSNGDYGVSAVAPLPPQEPEFLKVNFTTLCGYGAKTAPGPFTKKFAGCKFPGTAGANTVPFLTNQTKCGGGEPVTTATLDSYQSPGAQSAEGFPVLSDPNWKIREAKSPEIVGCNGLEFKPKFEGRPTTSVADSPSGLDFHLQLPQAGLLDKESLAEAHLKDTTVTLPAGMAVNPSAASGLEACTSAQIGMRTAVGQIPAHFSGLPDNCPAASKIGTVEVITPLLDKPLQGTVYLAKQFDNPFNSLLALYIAVDDPETGVVGEAGREGRRPTR